MALCAEATPGAATATASRAAVRRDGRDLIGGHQNIGLRRTWGRGRETSRLGPRSSVRLRGRRGFQGGQVRVAQPLAGLVVGEWQEGVAASAGYRCRLVLQAAGEDHR